MSSIERHSEGEIDGVGVNVPDATVQAIPKVVAFLSCLPAQASTADPKQRQFALLYGLEGYDVQPGELWAAAKQAVGRCKFYPVPAELRAIICENRKKAISALCREIIVDPGRPGVAPTVRLVTEEQYEKYLSALPGTVEHKAIENNPDEGLSVRELHEKRKERLQQVEAMVEAELGERKYE